MKRIFIVVTALLLPVFFISIQAQNIGINSTGATPDASAMLDVASTTRGLLAPRVALTATNAATPVPTPATSLIVYNTATAGTTPNNVIPGFYFWNGTAWIPFLAGTSTSNAAWMLSGNAGTSATNNFVGTTDNIPIVFRSNNQSHLELGSRTALGLVQPYTDYTDGTEKITYVRSAIQFDAPAASFYKPKMWTDGNGNFRMKGSSAGTDYFEFGATGTANAGGFDFIIGDDGDEPIVFKSYNFSTLITSEIMRLQSGRMAIGSSSFDPTNPEKLLVDNGTTGSFNLMTGRGNIDNYLQINVKNNSAGTNASSDLVATANNGTESINFIDLGINSSGYSGGVMGGANDAYLYNTGQNLLIGTGTAAKALIFLTGGTTLASNERMRIDGSGNVGINATVPGNKLDVNSGTAGASGLRLRQLTSGSVLYVNATTDVAQSNTNLFFDATNNRLSIAGGTTPTSTLQIGGSMSAPIATKTASYTATATDHTIICNQLLGNITITLPAANVSTGRIYAIKRVTALGGNVTIDPNAAELIDGVLTRVISGANEGVLIQCDGSNWYVISKI